MEPGETDEDVANVTIEDVSDDIVRQRVDQALAREEAAAELIEVSFVHDAPDYTIELYNEGVHVCDLVAEGVFETRTQVGRCWSMRFAGQTLQEWEIAGAGLLRLNAAVKLPVQRLRRAAAGTTRNWRPADEELRKQWAGPKWVHKCTRG